MIQLFFFALSLWLGGYLLASSSDKQSLTLTGWGLLAYSALLAWVLLGERVVLGLWLLPALLWIGSALHLWPPATPWRRAAITAWLFGSIPALILALLEPWLAVLPLLALMTLAYLLIQRARRGHFRDGLVVIATVSLFLALSSGAIVLPSRWLASAWGQGLLGLDLILLGLAVTWWDAFDEGQRLRQPLLRSLVASFYFTGLLAALVLIAAALDGRLTGGMRFLLVTVVAVGILSQVFASQLHGLLDRLALGRTSDLVGQRQLLRVTADNLVKVPDPPADPIDEQEFVRLTRQALSQLGDLAKLAASPLTNLTIVADRRDLNPLERAHRLKHQLTASIDRLKPRTGEEYGFSDEWRYYNALYYPYVVGLSPYTRQPPSEHLDEASRRALDWFQTSVPERTLYNWQATAAELVAQDLLSSDSSGGIWQ